MKPIIVQYDDIYLGNTKLEVFEELKKEFPDFKVTFFVIMYDFNTIEYIQSLKKDWIELVYHADEHRGDWLKWTKEEAKQNILKCQKYGFAQGLKFPGWRMTKSTVEVINELGYWDCICGTEPMLREIRPNKAWVTRHLGFNKYKDYAEMYGHIQETDFMDNINKLKIYLRNKGGDFKFISEVVSENYILDESKIKK